MQNMNKKYTSVQPFKLKLSTSYCVNCIALLSIYTGNADEI